MRVVLLCPARRFIANRFGIGYQMPLGLVFIGGSFVGAGHDVTLIDNDVLGLRDEVLTAKITELKPDCIMIGHTGSTAAHPVSMRTAACLKKNIPSTRIVYGGVFPTYASRRILEENPAIDIVVRGEGEETAVEILSENPCEVRGITWRCGDMIISNTDRPAAKNLDDLRPGWELVDWNAYKLFGFGRSAGMQFSRGCPLRCTFCGQWSFWKKWRHRSPENFVRHLEILRREYDVRAVWLADENFAADPEVTHAVLELLASRNLGLSINLNVTAADVVRDERLLPLYKRAGIDHVIVGIEALDDLTVESIRKNNPFAVSKRAVQLLRENRILSLVNIIYGLHEECAASMWNTLLKLLELDPDTLNAVYLTPHFWTAVGRGTKPEEIIQHDLAFYSYRNQILRSGKLSPLHLFACVKLTESLFHLRPKALLRILTFPDRKVRQMLRHYLLSGSRVVLAEIYEFVFKVRFRKGDVTCAPLRHPVKQISE